MPHLIKNTVSSLFSESLKLLFGGKSTVCASVCILCGEDSSLDETFNDYL